MKNSLLALMALCTASASTLPLWAADWEDPTLTSVDPNLTEDAKGGGVYYLYHVATKQFAVDGNNKYTWGTELVVGDEGKKITLSWGQDYELSRRELTDVAYNDAYGWRMSMKEGKTNSKLHELYIPAELVLCVDHNKQGHMLWKIVKQDNGYYRIKISDSDPLYGAKSEYANDYIGVVEGSKGVNPLIREGMEGVVNPQYDWQFVEPDVYDVYQAKKKLQTQLTAADEAGFTDYAKYAELYKSDKATVEDIEKAAENLQTDILNYKYSSASADHPLTVTELIQNASMGSNADGWTTWRATTNNNFQWQGGRSDVTSDDGFNFTNFFERWTASAPHGDWYIQQDLSGLPDGKYKLSARIFTNVAKNEDGTGGPEGYYLFAKTVGGEFRTEATVASPTGGAYASRYSVDFSVIGGTATVGMRSEDSNGNWAGVGYFELEYYGMEGALTIRGMLNQAITDTETKFKENYSGQKFSNVGRSKYEETVALAKEAAANEEVSDDSLTVLISSLSNCLDSVAADVKAYKTLESTINELNTEWENSDFVDYELPDYDEFLTKLEDGYANLTFDPSEVDSIKPHAVKIWQSEIIKLIKDEGLEDITGLLQNPNFTGTNNGWTYKFIAGDNNCSNGHDMAEAYQTAFDMYQEFEGMPAGSYEITLQGFHRPTWNGTCAEAWGDESNTTNEIKAYAYGNESTAKLHHVFDYLQDENIAENCEQLTVGELNGKWVPNGLASASAVMTADESNYRVVLKCYVNDDGKLKIGVTMPSQGASGYWTAFDNFKLTYLGADDMSGAEAPLNVLVQEATDMLNKEALSTKEAKDGLNSAINSANSALEAGLTYESYTEQTKLLNDAIEDGQAALDAASAFDAMVTGYVNKLDLGGFDEYDDTQAYNEFYDLLIELDGLIESDALESVAQINEKTVQVDEALAKMMASIIDVSTASINTPVDMTTIIQSPSFSMVDTEGNEVASKQGWISSTGNDASSAMSYEFYNVENADIHQTLYGLPKGYYRLAFDGFYRAGDATPAALARRDAQDTLNAEVYVNVEDLEWREKLSSIFDGMSEYKYTTDDVVLADTLFPESTLLYNIIVNNVTGGNLAFQDGLYAGDFSFYVPENGQNVTIGVRKEKLIKNDWTLFDNFTLLYYGDGDTNQPDDFVSSVEEAVADGKATVVSSAWYTINGVRVAEPKQRGIYIRQDKMSDGTTQSVKVMVR